MKKTKDIKKLTLRQEVVRTLMAAELKTVIGAGNCNSNTSSGHSKEGESPTTC